MCVSDPPIHSLQVLIRDLYLTLLLSQFILHILGMFGKISIYFSLSDKWLLMSFIMNNAWEESEENISKRIDQKIIIITIKG